MSLLVVGSIAFDAIRTPHGVAQDALGGSAVYFSLAAALFAPVRLVGVVGGDFAEENVDFLQKRGVDVSGIERVKSGKTFHWEGEYSADMNSRRTVSVELNVFAEFQPKIPASFRDSNLVFLANGPPVTQASVLEQVKAPLFAVADTMDLWIETTNAELRRLLGRVQGLFINESEVVALTGRANLVEAGRAAQVLGPRRVIVKKGEHGAILFDGDSVLPFPAFPVRDVRDPTGAGDSFAGAFMGYLAKRVSEGAVLSTPLLKEALAMGTVVASFTVEAFGVAGIAEATPHAVRARFEAYREMLRI